MSLSHFFASCFMRLYGLRLMLLPVFLLFTDFDLDLTLLDLAFLLWRDFDLRGRDLIFYMVYSMSLKPLVCLNMFRLTLFIFLRERLRPRELTAEVAERPDLADFERDRFERAGDLPLLRTDFFDFERLVEPSLRRLALF